MQAGYNSVPVVELIHYPRVLQWGIEFNQNQE